jgi:hypothetical protein
MRNITLALDEKTIAAGREYARRHNMTLNSLVRKLLQQTVSKGSKDWIEESHSLMDKVRIPRDAPKTWRRGDLYRG